MNLFNLVTRPRATYRDYMRFVTTVRELEAYSDRELRDFGISRTDIRRVVRENSR